MFYNVHSRVMGGNLESEMKMYSLVRKWKLPALRNCKSTCKLLMCSMCSVALFDTFIFAIDTPDLNTIFEGFKNVNPSHAPVSLSVIACFALSTEIFSLKIDSVRESLFYQLGNFSVVFCLSTTKLFSTLEN